MRTPIITTTTATITTIMSVVLLLTTINVTNTSSQEEEKTLIEYPGLLINEKRSDYTLAKDRTKRGVFWDLFQKVVITKNLIVDVIKLKIQHTSRSFSKRFKSTQFKFELFKLFSFPFSLLNPVFSNLTYYYYVDTRNELSC